MIYDINTEIETLLIYYIIFLVFKFLHGIIDTFEVARQFEEFKDTRPVMDGEIGMGSR